MSNHADENDAAERIHFLNGGTEGRHAMAARLAADEWELASEGLHREGCDTPMSQEVD